MQAPELASTDHKVETEVLIDPFKADVFSYGFLLYECITFRREPLCRAEITNNFEELIKEPIELRDGEMNSNFVQVPEKLCELVARCLMHTPHRRPGFDEILATLEELLMCDVPCGGMSQETKELVQEPDEAVVL